MRHQEAAASHLGPAHWPQTARERKKNLILKRTLFGQVRRLHSGATQGNRTILPVPPPPTSPPLTPRPSAESFRTTTSSVRIPPTPTDPLSLVEWIKWMLFLLPTVSRDRARQHLLPTTAVVVGDLGVVTVLPLISVVLVLQPCGYL